MGALGTSQGRRFRLHLPTLQFAQAHGVEIRACQAGDAKRKGKVERPFRVTKERFLEELVAVGPPATLDELNSRSVRWLTERVHTRPHRATSVAPAARLDVEAALLALLPRRRYDTAYVEARRVHGVLPMIEWRGVAGPCSVGHRQPDRCHSTLPETGVWRQECRPRRCGRRGEPRLWHIYGTSAAVRRDPSTYSHTL
jgi:hypothetical protein